MSLSNFCSACDVTPAPDMTSLAPPVNIVMGCHWTKKNLKSEYVATALDEARQREVQRHNQNVSRYSIMMKHHIDVAIFSVLKVLHFGVAMSLMKVQTEKIFLNSWIL